MALERAGIPFTVHEYAHDPRHESYGREASEALGVSPDRVFKTLIAEVDGTLVAGVVPVEGQLDLKALARLSGDRKVDTVHLKEVQPLTGYLRGGVTALAAKKEYPVFVDETIELWGRVSISAGIRGAQLLIAPADYLKATSARTAPIAKFSA